MFLNRYLEGNQYALNAIRSAKFKKQIQLLERQ